MIKTDSGFLAVSPTGHLVNLPAGTALKPGFRIATNDDLAKVREIENARAAEEGKPGGGPLA